METFLFYSDQCLMSRQVMSKLTQDVAVALKLSCVCVDSDECLRALKQTSLRVVPTIVITDANAEPKIYEGGDALVLVERAVQQLERDMASDPVAVPQEPSGGTEITMLSELESEDPTASVRGIVRAGKSTQEMADAMAKERELEDEMLTKRPPIYNDIEERMAGFLA